MEDESVEDRSVEVLQIPASLEDDLLWLYFENKRRSGGGNLISLERTGDKAVLVFENADAAVKVVEKGSHTLSNATLIVRKKPWKDVGKLLLRGLSLTTSRDMLELYVENLTGIESDHYTLYPSPGKDLVLVHLHQPAAEDFNKMQSKVSKRSLDGARVTLEQVECTDSIVVENLHPDLTEDLLTLYFESSRSGGGEVTAVSRISSQLAKVSFKDVQTVDSVLQKPHRLEEMDLIVKPYYTFLHSEEGASQETLPNGTPQSEDDPMGPVSPSNVLHADRTSTGSSLTPSQQAVTMNPDLQITSEPLNTSITPSQVLQAPLKQQPCVCHVSIPDPSKRELVSLCDVPEQLKQSHPDYEIAVMQNGVKVEGPSQDEAEKLKSKVLEFLSGVSQVHVPISELKAEFLQRKDVRDKLMDMLKLQGLPCTYTVTGGVLILSSASMQMVNRACDVVKMEVSESVLPIEPENKYMIYSEEWSAFLQTLHTCVARASPEDDSVSMVTLKDLEQEVKQNIVRFLSTPIPKEIVLSMQPAMLTYIQLHHQQLLMDMAEVVILPLDTEDGLSIQGNPTACQTAAEVLSSVVSSTYTKIITVNQPGIARFLLHDPEGIGILGEMTAKFQVYINLEMVHWKPLEDQDIFAVAWKMMSSQSFVRSSSSEGLRDLKASASSENDKDFSARLEEAKMILLMESDGSRTAAEEKKVEEKETEEEDMDLYTDTLSSGEQQEDLMSLDEDAYLSLAIQMSMESSQNQDRRAEEEFQQVLQLSRDEAASADESLMLVKAVDESLQEAISSANRAQIEVFACYTHDLVRVDIALGKKVGLRQCEEKLQHKSFRKLSAFHRRCLDLIRRKHAVDIQIQGTTAIVSGFRDYVAGAMPDLNALQESASGVTSDAEILKTVQWAWHEGEQAAGGTPYPPEATVFIENAWRMKQDKLDILFNNQPYTIDFIKMQEFSVSSGRAVPISRKLVSSLDLYTEFQDDYSLLADVPDAVRLEEHSEEYKEVSTEFFNSLSDKNQVHIVQVEKLMNRLLYSQYRLKKADMEQKVRGEVERTLYHGTSESSVKEICIHGFNRSFCGKNGEVH
ncbi:poly [ADP-ribose] polymerase 10, partial [Silurus meridionalis]